MTFKKKLSERQERALLRDYRDGWTIKELTIIYRVSTRTVFRTLADYGVPRVRKRSLPRRYKNQRKARPELKPCGTNAAYARHKRAGEYPCTACLEAHSEDQKRWKARREAKERNQK